LTVTRVVHSGKPPARTSSARPTASESRARSDFDRLKTRYARHGYRVDLKVDANAAIDFDCAKHSYGTWGVPVGDTGIEPVTSSV
jgi:hypothetical protein